MTRVLRMSHYVYLNVNVIKEVCGISDLTFIFIYFLHENRVRGSGLAKYNVILNMEEIKQKIKRKS